MREIERALRDMAPMIARAMLADAAFGNRDTQRALLPYIMPRATKVSTAISTAIEIDVSSTQAAKDTLQRIAAAIGKGEIGLEEGTLIMESVGRSLDRIAMADVAEMAARLDKLESEQADRHVGAHATGAKPLSRANGSTPKWGNIEHHPSLKVVGGTSSD